MIHLRLLAGLAGRRMLRLRGNRDGLARGVGGRCLMLNLKLILGLRRALLVRDGVRGPW